MPKSMKLAHDFEKKWRSDDVRLREEASFSSLLLNKNVLNGLKNAGYEVPSPIQLEAIPVGLFGRDLLVQAKSGTGKTLVFTIVALELLLKTKHPQVLMIAPTREVAMQICDVVKTVGSSFKNLSCKCFIGGIKIENDQEQVKGCQIVVGTTGRLKHLINLGILSTTSIRLLVIDEFDVMIEPQFKEDIDYIFSSLPKDKQIIATSATYPKEMKSFMLQYFRNAYVARLNYDELSLLGMVHYIYPLEIPKMALLEYKAKLEALKKVLYSIKFVQCLVFCNLVSRVESLCLQIREWDFDSTFISGAQDQSDRINAINCLKEFKCRVLVTSDLTARGIDAENVDLVVHFDKPYCTETYFHRSGRAGRYGSKGVAVTLIAKEEILFFKTLQHKNFEAYLLPDPIPINLINLRPEISPDIKNINSEESSPENKVAVEAVKNEENNLASSENLDSALPNESDNEISTNENSKNFDGKILSSNDILHAKVGCGLTDDSSRKMSADDLDLTEEYACNLSYAVNNENSKNFDNEILSSNDVLHVKLGCQLTDNSSQNISANNLDLTEEYAFNLSYAENNEAIYRDKNDQNLNEKPSEIQENDKNSNSDSKENIKDEKNHFESVENSPLVSYDEMTRRETAVKENSFNVDTADNISLPERSGLFAEAKKNTASEKSLDAFEKKYVSMRSNLNEFYMKVFKEYQATVKEGSMLDDVTNILVKQSDVNINEFIKRSKSQATRSIVPIEVGNIDHHLSIKNTNISSNDENKKKKAEFVPKSKQNISNKRNTLHSTPKPLTSFSLSGSNGNADRELSVENSSDSLTTSIKNIAKLETKNRKYSGAQSFSSSSSLESLSNPKQARGLSLSKTAETSKGNEKGNTSSVKQNKLIDCGYLKNKGLKEETNATDEKPLGAKKKTYRMGKRTKIRERSSHLPSYSESEMSDEKYYHQERHFRNKHLVKTHKKKNTSNAYKTESYEDVFDPHQYNPDITYPSANTYVSSQQDYNRWCKCENAARQRDPRYPSNPSFNFGNNSRCKSSSQHNYPPYVSYNHANIPGVDSHKYKNQKACDCQSQTHCSCNYDPHCHRDFSSCWYDEYYKQWKFIQDYIFSYY